MSNEETVILKAFRRKGEEYFTFPNIVIGTGNSLDECNKIAQEFADNNPDLINISWDYR